MAKANMLVVEDELLVAEDIRERLTRLGYAVSGMASSGEEALLKAEESQPDLVMMDIKLKGDMDGVQAAEEIRHRFDIPVVYLTAYADENILERAKVTAPYGYVLKPFESRDLASTIEMALYKHQMDKKLRDGEARLRAIFEAASNVGLVMTDLGGTNARIMEFSPGAECVFDYAAEDVIGKQVAILHLPEDMAGFSVMHESMRKWKEGFTGEWTLIRKNGERFLALFTMHPVLDANDDVIAALCVTIDISEREEAEEALRESEAFNSALFQHNAVPTVVVDWDGKVIEYNLAKKNSGDRLPEIGDVMYQDYAIKHEIDMHAELIACIRSGHVREFAELKYQDKYLNIIMSPFPKGAMIMSRDITERKQAEDEAARASALEELDRLRKALLSSVTHELRTPLTSIMGMASTLVQPDVEWDAETQEDYLTSIVRESERLSHIISDLVDMSQLEAGLLRIEKRWYKVPEIVNQLGDQLKTLVGKHKLDIIIPPDLPEVYVDETRFGEVITNLVANAAAYSDEGTQITVEAGKVNNDVVFSVADQGIGIPAEHLNKVFDQFYRLEGGATRRKGGTGLGLSICKGIIEAHDGRIWVESKQGEGSKFIFSLPHADSM